jgi:hypothetical protein
MLLPMSGPLLGMLFLLAGAALRSSGQPPTRIRTQLRRPQAGQRR